MAAVSVSLQKVHSATAHVVDHGLTACLGSPRKHSKAVINVGMLVSQSTVVHVLVVIVVWLR